MAKTLGDVGPRYVPADDVQQDEVQQDAPPAAPRELKRSAAYQKLIDANRTKESAPEPAPPTLTQRAMRSLADATATHDTAERPAGQRRGGAAVRPYVAPDSAPEAPAQPPRSIPSGPGVMNALDVEASGPALRNAAAVASRPPAPVPALERPAPPEAREALANDASIAPWELERQREEQRLLSQRNAATMRAAEPQSLSERAGAAVKQATGNERMASMARGATDAALLVPEAMATGTKLAADIANLATLGAAQPVSDWLGATVKAVQNAKSNRFQGVQAEFSALLKNPDAGVLDIVGFMAANPAFTVEMGAPSVPSMLFGASGAAIGAKLLAKRASTETAAKLGAGGANVAMNAGDTFSSTKGDVSDKLLAAGAAAAGTALMGRFDGAETAIAAGGRGGAVKRALSTAPQEAAQEFGESMSQSLGQGTAEGNFDVGSSLKQAASEGVIGGVMGAGAGALARNKDGVPLRPTEHRKAIDTNLDDFAATHGMNPKALAAIKAEAAKKPLSGLSGFYKRAVTAMSQRGLIGGQIDDGHLAALDDPAPPDVSRETPPAQDAGAIDAAELLGTPEPDAPAAPRSTATVTGDAINKNWSAFSPDSGTLGIPREQMPQISAEHRGALVNFLNARGVEHQTREVPASALTPTQAEFSPQRVQGAADFQGGDRSILVSRDGHILDGTHQWLAKLDADAPVKVIELDAPIQDLLRLAHQFPSSTTARGVTRTSNAEAPAQPPAEPAAPQSATAEPAASAPDQAVEPAPVLAPAEPAQVDQAGPALVAGAASDSPTMGAESKNAEPPPAKPVAESQAPPSSAGGDGGVAPAQAAGGRIIARAGKTPNATEPITLRQNKDGTVTPHMGKYALLDFNSGEPINLPADTSDADAKKAIRDAGAVSKKINFFPIEKHAEAANGTPSDSAGRPDANGAGGGSQSDGSGPFAQRVAADAGRLDAGAAGEPVAGVRADQPDGNGRPADAVAPPQKVDQRGARAKARMAFNPETDSMLQALAKMGGIRRDVVANEFGLKPEDLKHTVAIGGLKGFPFRKNGGMGLDDAMMSLQEAGYFTGVPDEDVSRKFEEAIYAELGGDQELTPLGQMRRSEEMHADRATEDDPFAPGGTLDSLNHFTAEDLEESGYADADPETKALTQARLAEAEALGIDTEALREDAARGIEEQSEDFYHARLQQAAADAIAKAREDAAGRDTEAARRVSEDRGQVAGDQGQEQSHPDFALTAPTRAQALDQQAAIEQEQADREAPADKPKSKFTGEQVDIFNTQASVFDAPAEAAPAPTAPPKSLPSPKPERPEATIELRKQLSVLKALRDCLKA